MSRETRIATPSVQSLLILMMFDGQPLSTGTGFVVLSGRGPMLVTNRHNVTGRHQETGKPLSKTCAVPNEIVIIHNKNGHLGEWLPKREKLYDDDRPRWFEHPKFGAAADFVTLPLVEISDVRFFPYDPIKPGSHMYIGPTSVVSVIGFPFSITGGGALGIWATGFVASEPDIDFQGKPTFLIDCRTREGQSGSAVIAYRAPGAPYNEAPGITTTSNVEMIKFLGIYSGRINSQSDLGVVWKASAIAELITSV